MNAIVFIAHCYPSGLVYHLAHLASALQQACIDRPGRDVFYVCSHSKEQFPGTWDWLRARIPASQIITLADYHADFIAQMRRLLETHEKVLVHCGGGQNQLAPLCVLRREYGRRLKIIVTTHAYHIEDWKRPIAGALQALQYLRHVDHVIFQCPYAARRFVGSTWLFRHGRASVIPLGVEAFDPICTATVPSDPLGAPDIRPLLQETGWFNLIYLAELRPAKEHAWVVDAIGPILKAHRQVRVLFPGGGHEQNAVCRKIAAQGLEGRIVAPGRIDRQHIPWVLGKCHGAIVASRAETFGHCFVEPMFAGLPVVGNRVGVAEYLLQDLQTGIGYPRGDMVAFRAAIQYLLTHREETVDMGRTARNIATQLFTHEAIAQAHVRLYRKVLDA